MTPAEKAATLEEIANLFITKVCDEAFSILLLECAAHFRALIPDANGLLPCPMCGAGGSPKITSSLRSSDFTVHCGKCSLTTVYYMTKAEVIAAWNRRGGVV